MMQRPEPFPPDAEFTYIADGQRQVAFTAVDFWRWGFSNIRENVIRGILAEYIVARALEVEVKARQS